jgi:iron complex outermembrane receptor protein
MQKFTHISNLIQSLIIFILIGWSFPLWGAVIILGTLFSEETRQPVAYAHILLQGSDRGVISDVSGNFTLNVSDLPVTLEITHIAFEKVVLNVNRSRLGKVYLKANVLSGERVLVWSSRAVAGKTPVAFSDLSRAEIERQYSHQDVPMVLAQQPGVYAYSDAGNGVGYSYLKIRGFQQDRIGVMLNGIPLNDPEAHAVYWVDHADIISAASNIQLQRGVGNSLFGSAVFGGTVNMTMNYHALERGFKCTVGYGNYTDKGLNLPSTKFALSYNQPLTRFPGIFTYVRISQMKSDGYRIGSGTRQLSAHLGLERLTRTSLTRLEAIVGDEKTAFAWEGVIPLYGYNLNDRRDRRYNYYADPQWNGGRKNSNQDVFRQSVLALHHSQKFGSAIASATLYNVAGKGYYEQFKGDQKVDEYNLSAFLPDTVEKVDLIRRKWLENGYQGLVAQFALPMTFGTFTVGADLRLYHSKHYGKVVEILEIENTEPDQKYYSDRSRKNSFSAFAHLYFELTRQLGLMVDLRYLGHRYKFDQAILGAFQTGYRFCLRHDFLDPHFGINYKINPQLSVFVNVSTAHREPTDADIYDHDDPQAVLKVRLSDSHFDEALVKAESLIDYEAGCKWSLTQADFQLNLYRMDFRNELIPTEYQYYDADQILHANAGRTLHQGVELVLKLDLLSWLKLTTNFSYADNHFVDFSADSLGWSGGGGIADFSGKVLPCYPAYQSKGELQLNYHHLQTWLQLSYTGKQYIDLMNTEAAAINPAIVLNWGLKIKFPKIWQKYALELELRIYNVTNTLYESFGYNYYDEDPPYPPYRVDAYWPAATRNYYLIFQIVL